MSGVFRVKCVFWVLLCVPLLAFTQNQLDIPTPLSEKLFNILNQEKSIEKTLWRLDEIDPALRSNFILVYRSQSAQGASFQNPRALLYTKKADFVLSFNGHSSQKGHSNIELLEFNSDSARFVLRDLKLVSDALGNKSAVLSEKNPQTCVKCHQSVTRNDIDPRPNWEPHQHWFGVYGSLDGLAGYANWFYKRNNTDTLEEVVDLQRSSEIENLTQNRKTIAEHALIDRELTEEAHEYAKFWESYKNKTLSERYLVLKPRESVLLKFPEPLTAYFSRAISERNYERVLRILSGLPEFKYNKEFLRYCLMTSNFNGADKEQLFNDSLGLVRWNNQYSKTRFRKKATQAVPRDNDGTCLEWLFESMGLNTSDWSVDFYSGARFAKSSRFGGPDYPKTDFLKILSTKYPMPTSVYTDEGTLLYSSQETPLEKSKKTLAYYQTKVSSFQEQQLARLSKRDEILLTSGHVAPEAYGHCIRCHSKPALMASPEIPFNDLHALQQMGPQMIEKIKHRLSEDVTDNLRMPPDAVLTRAEKDQILDFIQQNSNTQ